MYFDISWGSIVRVCACHAPSLNRHILVVASHDPVANILKRHIEVSGHLINPQSSHSPVCTVAELDGHYSVLLGLNHITTLTHLTQHVMSHHMSSHLSHEYRRTWNTGIHSNHLISPSGHKVFTP